MRPFSVLLLLFAACLLPFAGAHAVSVKGLQNAVVEVADKSEAARRKAFRTGLERVLVKMAGSTAVLEREDTEDLLENPEGLVQQYRYERLETDDDTDDGEDGDGDDSGSRYRLSVSFDGERIERRVRELGVVVWGAERPEVLVWLGVDDGRERRVLGADADSAAYRALRRAAQRRGLPVLWPLMDAEDRGAVDFVDVSGGFFEALDSASQRYRADILLIGHVRRTGGEWRGDWTLLGPGERRAWTGAGDDVAAVVDAGVDGATDRLAALLAGEGGERTRLKVRVEDVTSLADYARVTGYLKDLGRVRGRHLREAGPESLLFELEIRGGLDGFERIAALGNTLDFVRRRMPDDGADEATEDAAALPELVFRLAD